MRVVITHDFFETYGGAERVTAEIAAAFPDAPVHAILGRRSVAVRMGIDGRDHTILPPREVVFRRYRALAPVYPALVRCARLPEADVVVSSSYAYAHAFATTGHARRLCYSHGPLRHLWSQTDAYAAHLPGGRAGRAAFGAYAALARVADRSAADRVDGFLTQSPFTAEMIERAYGRSATVLPPPVHTDVFVPSGRPSADYFLFVGRLVEAYKRPSLVVEAFARMPERRLLIAGDGPARADLERQATPNVEFLGPLGDRDLVRAMQDCQAAIFPSVDDYGLVPLEVNACGRPVLALRAGGSLYTVAPGITGEYLEKQTTQAIVRAVQTFDPTRYDPVRIRAHAESNSSGRFRREIHAAAEKLMTGPPAELARNKRRTSLTEPIQPPSEPEPMSPSPAGDHPEEPRLQLREQDVAARRFKDETIILDLRRSTYLATNPAASVLWRELEQGTTRTGLIEAILAEFDVETERAARDVDAFITLCRQRGLLADPTPGD